MDKIKENKFVVKAKKIWSKHKIIVSVLGGFLVLICLFGIREASLVDPLDGVQQVAWNSYTGSWVVPDKDRDRIASKIRASILKSMAQVVKLLSMSKIIQSGNTIQMITGQLNPILVKANWIKQLMSLIMWSQGLIFLMKMEIKWS